MNLKRELPRPLFYLLACVGASCGILALSLAPVLIPISISLTTADAAQYSVSAIDDSFSPNTMTVPAGSTVVWTNAGMMQHTVTADDGSFDSGTLSPGGSYSHTFNTPGTYHYYCRFHGGPGGVGMSGTIIVTGTANNYVPPTQQGGMQQQQQSQSQYMPGMQANPYANTSTYSPSQTSYSYAQPSYTQTYNAPQRGGYIYPTYSCPSYSGYSGYYQQPVMQSGSYMMPTMGYWSSYSAPQYGYGYY